MTTDHVGGLSYVSDIIAAGGGLCYYITCLFGPRLALVGTLLLLMPPCSLHSTNPTLAHAQCWEKSSRCSGTLVDTARRGDGTFTAGRGHSIRRGAPSGRTAGTGAGEPRAARDDSLGIASAPPPATFPCLPAAPHYAWRIYHLGIISPHCAQAFIQRPTHTAVCFDRTHATAGPMPTTCTPRPPSGHAQPLGYDAALVPNLRFYSPLRYTPAGLQPRA